MVKKVWCFEAFPSLGSCASKLTKAYLRILSWNFRSTGNFASIFATTNCDVQLLKPTPEEEQKSYFHGFMERMVHGRPLINASQDDAIKQRENEIRCLQGKLQQAKEDHERLEEQNQVQDDAIKQRENEIRCLQGKLQQAKEDHDLLEAQNQVYKEHIEKACAALHTLEIKTKALEASHDDAIWKLQQVKEDQAYQEHVEKSCAELDTLTIKTNAMEMADLLA